MLEFLGLKRGEKGKETHGCGHQTSITHLTLPLAPSLGDNAQFQRYRFLLRLLHCPLPFAIFQLLLRS